VLAGSVTGIIAWREGRLAPNWSFHFGLVLAGWGIFNLVEGTVDHHLLEVHHVRDDVGAPRSPGTWRSSPSECCSSSAAGCCTGEGSGHWRAMSH